MRVSGYGKGSLNFHFLPGERKPSAYILYPLNFRAMLKNNGSRIGENLKKNIRVFGRVLDFKFYTKMFPPAPGDGTKNVS
jgi:hypothetical protein